MTSTTIASATGNITDDNVIQAMYNQDINQNTIKARPSPHIIDELESKGVRATQSCRANKVGSMVLIIGARVMRYDEERTTE